MPPIVCVECDRVIRNYEPARQILTGSQRGKWMHKGKCPSQETRDSHPGFKSTVSELIEDAADAIADIFD